MVKSAKMKTTTTMVVVMVMIVVMIAIKPADARVNLTAGRTFMRDEWFSVKYQSQALEPHERYYFEQIITGLDLQDIDADVDNDERPQAGECVRKEYRRMTAEEVRGFQAALNTMEKNGELKVFVQHHRPSDSPGAHFGPAFFCWHRVFLILFENAIRRHCPICCLPYVDTRLDCPLPIPSESALFSAQHFGNNRGPVRTGMAGNWQSQPTDCNIFGFGVLTRFADMDPCWSGLQYTPSMIRTVMDSESYDDLCQPYDFSDMESEHGGPHMWMSGHMTALPCAPLDPFFWCHHGFVDMLIEKLRDTLPAHAWRYPNNWNVPWAHRATDPMRPFNFRNADGMDDETIGKNYIYEISPAEIRCSTDEECSPIGLLWCDTANGLNRCKAKCRVGGRCVTGVHGMCHCETGTPRCEARTCRC